MISSKLTYSPTAGVQDDVAAPRIVQPTCIVGAFTRPEIIEFPSAHEDDDDAVLDSPDFVSEAQRALRGRRFQRVNRPKRRTRTRSER